MFYKYWYSQNYDHYRNFKSTQDPSSIFVQSYDGDNIFLLNDNAPKYDRFCNITTRIRNSKMIAFTCGLR